MVAPFLVAGLKNWLRLAKKLMEQTDFWYANINLGKFKVTLIVGLST